MTRIANTEPGIATGSTPRRVGSFPRTDTWTFYFLLALLILPVALFDIFPSQDGAAHLANGAIYIDPGESIHDDYFDIQWFPLVPNVLVDLVLGTFLLSLSPFIAERILVLALLVGLPLSMRWCLAQFEGVKSVRPSVLAIPLGASLLLYFGFYSWLLGLTLAVLAMGYWLRTIRSAAIRPTRLAVLAGLMMLVFTSHPFPFLALLVFLSAASFDQWLKRRRIEEALARETARRQALAIVIASAVPTVLLAIYALDQRGAGFAYGRSLLERIVVLPVDALVTFSYWEIPFALLASAGIVLAGAAGLWLNRRSALRSPGFLVAALLFVVAYFVSPNEVGPGGVVLPRLALLIMVASVLWVGTLTLPRWTYTTITVIAALATIGLTAVRIPAQIERHERMTEFVTGIPLIEAESTVLPLWGFVDGVPQNSRIEFPRKNWSGYLAATRGAVDLSHSPAYTDSFPVAFRPGYDIRAISDSGEDAFVLGRTLVDAPRYASQGPGQIDYVLIWGEIPDDAGAHSSPHFEEWLQSGYELVFVSSPRGLLEIYERSR